MSLILSPRWRHEPYDSEISDETNLIQFDSSRPELSLLLLWRLLIIN